MLIVQCLCLTLVGVNRFMICRTGSSFIATTRQKCPSASFWVPFCHIRVTSVISCNKKITWPNPPNPTSTSNTKLKNSPANRTWLSEKYRPKVERIFWARFRISFLNSKEEIRGKKSKKRILRRSLRMKCWRKWISSGWKMLRRGMPLLIVVIFDSFS